MNIEFAVNDIITYVDSDLREYSAAVKELKWDPVDEIVRYRLSVPGHIGKGFIWTTGKAIKESTDFKGEKPDIPKVCCCVCGDEFKPGDRIQVFQRSTDHPQGKWSLPNAALGVDFKKLIAKWVNDKVKRRHYGCRGEDE